MRSTDFTDRRVFQLRLFLEGAAVGLAAGLSVALYRALITEAEAWRGLLYARVLTPAAEAGNFLAPALWLAALLALAFLLARAVAWEPMAKGSGIPQVKGILSGRMKFLSPLRVLAVQIFGGALAIGAGLSLGHAGPAVEIGAASAAALSKAAGHRSYEMRRLVASGAAAGLAAVFNAPLAGVVFAVEALSRHFAAATLLPAMSAAAAAALVIRALFGPATIFRFEEILPIPAAHIPYVLLLSVLAGAAAVPFNRALLSMDRFYRAPLFTAHWQKIFFALSCAFVLGFLFPPILGGGEALAAGLTGEAPLSFLLLLLVGKALFTLLSFGCGVPGGFFFPSLVLGALTGAAAGAVLLAAGLLSPMVLTNVIILTMAAFFSASVRAPITGAVLLLEMTGSFAHLLPLTLAASAAYITAGLLGGKPIYDELLKKMNNVQ